MKTLCGLAGLSAEPLVFVAGVWFAQFLRKQPSDEHGTMVVKSIPAGLALGVICSMAVHGLLMVAYHNLHFGPMLIGIIFGIGGGILTGVVISFFYVMANRLGLIKAEEGT